MKTKKFEKKLFFNKKTIADLNNGELKNVHAGEQSLAYQKVDTEVVGCPTAIPCTAAYTNCFSNYPVACQCGAA